MASAKMATVTSKSVGFGSVFASRIEHFLASHLDRFLGRGMCIVNTEAYGLFFFYSPLCDRLSQVQTSRLNSTAGTSPQSNLICFI